MANTPSLRPGGKGDVSETGMPVAFKDSMTAATDAAFNIVLPPSHQFEVNTNSPDARDRRRLFVAIAQGIVHHLCDNARAFEILDSRNNPTGDQISIQTDSTLL